MALVAMISPTGLDLGIICPMLRHLAFYDRRLYSDDARAMMLRVAAAESDLLWLEQRGGGPARSWWQIEPATAHDLLVRMPVALFAAGSPFIDDLNETLTLDEIGDRLARNPYAAAVMARIYWWMRDPEPMPPWRDLDAAAERWKTVYNTPRGAGTVEGFVERARRTGVEAYLEGELG